MINESEYYFKVKNLNRIIDNKNIFYRIYTYKYVFCAHDFLVLIVYSSLL